LTDWATRTYNEHVDINVDLNKGTHEMSKYQISTIERLMRCTTADAVELLSVMDRTGDHPDWSESSDRQLRTHFRSVLADIQAGA